MDKNINNRVINCKKHYLNKLCFRDLEDWLKSNDDHIYIGRDQTRFIKGATGSKWANPFPVKKYGRDRCLELYRDYIKSNPELMNSLGELEGKILGCWCAPEPCHGDILIELLEERKDKKT